MQKGAGRVSGLPAGVAAAFGLRSIFEAPPGAGGDTNNGGTLALVAAADRKAGVFLRRPHTDRFHFPVPGATAMLGIVVLMAVLVPPRRATTIDPRAADSVRGPRQ